MIWNEQLFKFGYHGLSADYEKLENMSKNELVNYRELLDTFENFHNSVVVLRGSVRIEIVEMAKDLNGFWMNPDVIREGVRLINSAIALKVKKEMEQRQALRKGEI